MSSSLQTVKIDADWYTAEVIDTIKQTVCRGATDAQFKMFIEVCKATGLNPFLKEIWFVPNVGVMAGRDGYLRIANDHPMFDGMSTTVERDDQGIPIKATCSVWRKDRAHPITCEAFYNEYKKNSQVWTTYKSAMISKVAEVLALKRSFSINGIVTEEEMGEQKAAAQDAQQDVAQRRIQELQAAKLPASTIIELADSLDQTPEPPLMAPDVKKPLVSAYEKREAAKQDEAAAALKPSLEATAKRRRGAISFTALKSWGEIKKEILALTGTTDLYYEALKAGGYQHADEIKTQEDAAKIWKALKAIAAELGRSKQDKALMLEVEAHALRIGAMATQAALERRGLRSIEEVLTISDGTELDALLTELRTTV